MQNWTCWARPRMVLAVVLLLGGQLSGCSPAPAAKNSVQAGEPVPQPAAHVEAAAGSKEKTSEAAPTTDVVVVGAGISGLTAALDLGRGGARVTVIDMSSVFGGHAVMSQGSVSIVATPEQQKAGFLDSPDLAFKDFHEWGENPNTEWVRYYVDNSRHEIYDWLIELGVRFSEVVASSGNSVPREHQPIGRGLGLVTPIFRGCLELENIEFEWNSKAEQLLTSNGRIVGVLIRDLRTGEQRELRGRAVILATGGFQSNLDMVREFWPAEFRFPKRILAGSGQNSIGLGHRLAETAGGQMFHMDYQWNYFSGLPDPRYPGSNRGLNVTNMHGILVNSEAKRFANMHGWAKEVMPVLLKQDDTSVWCIFDEPIKPYFNVSGSDWADFKKVDKLIIQDPTLVKKAETLEKLAELTGLPANNLVTTVTRYNALVDKGVDTDFGRFGPGKPDFSNKSSPKIMTPPYYAMQTFPLTRKSMGGVTIDLQSRVTDRHQQPIPGLYAVGELAGLAGVNGKAALEGTFLGPCIVTGRVAARSLLKELKTAPLLAGANASRCTTCHDMPALLAERREGFWHFEKVHKAAAEKVLDCRHCHAELSPYQDDNHRIRKQSLTTSCVLCHVATE